MKNFTRMLIIASLALMTAFSAQSQDIFKAASVGIGTTNPAQKIEIAGTTNTIRINGLKAGGTYNPLTSAANSNSNFLYVNNSTGDISALASGGVGSILTISATGVPTWSTPTATSATAWQLLGNSITAPATPATYGTSAIGSGSWLGTTDGDDIVFGTNNIERLRIGGGSTATAGFLGIGTTTPVAALDISAANSGGAPAGYYIHIGGNNGASGVSTTTQGAYITWNDQPSGSVTNGETDFINSEGGGAGGFLFYNTSTAAGAWSSHTGTPLVYIAAAGYVAVPALSTAGGIAYISNSSTTGQISETAAGTSGQVLQSNGAGVPTWVTPTATSATAWQLLGNTGIGTPSAPATYGTTTITSGKNWFGTTDGNDVVFGTVNIERMRIGGGSVATAGYVGIGTASPASILHVVELGNQASGDFGGGSGYNTAVEIENKSGTMPILYINGSTSNNSIAGIIQRGSTTAFFEGLNNNKNFRIAGIASIAGSAVTTAKDGTAGITVLESNGDVGLNYITPANALDISGAEAIGSYAGTAAPTNGLIVSGNVGIGASTVGSGAALSVNQNGNVTSDFGTYNTAVEIQNIGGTAPFLYINGSTANNPLAGIIDRASTTAIYSGLNNSGNYRIAGITAITSAALTTAKDGTAGMTILESNGNVGLNYITPANALDISGAEAIGYAGTAAPTNGLIVSGSVGIGTSAPTQPLQVVGNVQFSKALMPNGAAGTLGNLLLSAGANTAPTWLAGGTSGQLLQANGTASAPTWVTPSVTAWLLTGNGGTTAGTNFIGTTNAEDLVFKTNNTEIMRIANSTNNVGIGTTTPNSASEVEIDQNFNGGGIGMLHLNSSGTEAGISFYESNNGNGAQQYSIKDGDNGAGQTWFAIHDETNNNQAFTIMPAQNNGNGEFNLVGIGQSYPSTILDLYYPAGDGTGNDGITIENGYEGDNFRLWVSDYNNSEDYDDGGFNIWNNFYGGDNFSIDVYSGNVGLGGDWQYSDPQAAMSVMGNGVIGYDYANDGYGAPGNGLLVEGQTSIGTTNNTNMLDVNGGEAIGSYAGNNSAPSNGLIVSGDVSLGTSSSKNQLDVAGGAAVGSYAGSNSAPTNGLIVSGQVGVGTSSPNAGAALDVTSSTQGVLIPRMATAPSSPITSMMYFNTTTGCFMFWNGTAWQAIACGCNSIPSAAGTITGSSTFCPGQTGVTYSVAAIPGATGYSWSIPSDATLTAGAGTNSITITFGNDAGTISVNGTNSCSSGAASTLTVVNGGAAITGQPANAAADCASPGTVTFTVTATGASLTYQWEVSTNSGGSWTSLGAGTSPYSNAQTATLSITSPTTGMNGYEYECIVTTTSCGGSSITSNAATLTTGLSSMPITLTNTVGSTTTSANLPVKLLVNFSGYTSGASDVAGILNTSLNNVEFTTGGSGSGTPLYAWIENGNSTSAVATAASSSSTSVVVWVNLGSTTITNGTPVTIYMNFMGSDVMTGATGYTGEAPELTGTYGQYDNGAKVFSFYDGFAGTSLNSSNWSSYASSSGTTTVNNGITFSVSTNPSTNVISSNSTFAPPFLAETYAYGGSPTNGGRTYSPGLITVTAATEGYSIDDNGTVANCMAFSGGQNGLIRYTPLQGDNNTNYEPGVGTPANYEVISLYYTGSNNYWYLNYGSIGNSSTGTPTGSLYFAMGEESNSTTTMTLKADWTRVRVSPPSNTLPTVSFGTFGCH